MKLLDQDGEIVPGIGTHLAPGHNRDMLLVTAASRGGTFCFFSDLVPTTAHLTPTWVPAFDLYPLESIDSKIRWLDKAAREGWFCGLGHDAEVAFTRVRRTEGKQIGFEAYASIPE
jgi:glyoxylase-like metal-dependent hydrolase (beta-lactamase superfamily II)